MNTALAWRLARHLIMSAYGSTTSSCCLRFADVICPAPLQFVQLRGLQDHFNSMWFVPLHYASGIIMPLQPMAAHTRGRKTGSSLCPEKPNYKKSVPHSGSLPVSGVSGGHFRRNEHAPDTPRWCFRPGWAS